MGWRLIILLQSVPPVYIGALVTVSLFLMSHLALAIWFAASVKSQVGQLCKTVDKMASELESLAKLDGRIQVIESRMERAEADAREAIRAAAALGLHVGDGR